MHRVRLAALLLLLLASSALGQRTVHHTFSSPGTKTITLRVCSANGLCTTTTRTLNVLDPRPTIRSSTSPAPLLGSAEAPLRLTAEVAGRPPLSPVWTISGSPLRSSPQSFPLATILWTPDALGLYRLTFSLSNSLGSVARPTVSTRVVASTFADVSPTSPFWPPIETLRWLGLSAGCSDSPPRFCTEATVSRAEAAVFVDTAKHSDPPPPATGLFLDVPPSFWAARFIERLYREGIAAGCTPSPLRFCPNDPLTREQIAVMLERARHGPGYNPPPAVGLFLDVPSSSPGAPWIEQFFRDGLTSGCAPQLFCPHDSATRGQMAVFLTGAFTLSQTPTPTSFLARACSPANCTFSGQPVHFDLNLTRGLPDTYEYDWNGDGVFEETGTLAIPTHLYASAGTYRPAVRLRRGSWSSTLVHPIAISIATPNVFRAPNAPVSPRVVFQRDRVPTLSDPPGTLPRRDLTLEASSSGARGFLLYAALDGGSYFYLTSLPAAPGLLPFFIPFQTRTLALKIFAFNDYGPSASATFVTPSLP